MLTAHLTQLLAQGPQRSKGRGEGELFLGGAHLGPRGGGHTSEGYLDHGAAGNAQARGPGSNTVKPVVGNDWAESLPGGAKILLNTWSSGKEWPREKWEVGPASNYELSLLRFASRYRCGKMPCSLECGIDNQAKSAQLAVWLFSAKGATFCWDAGLAGTALYMCAGP
eukprot:1147312-Pelagomonas_calceolata.AAC.5